MHKQLTDKCNASESCTTTEPKFRTIKFKMHVQQQIKVCINNKLVVKIVTIANNQTNNKTALPNTVDYA